MVNGDEGYPYYLTYHDGHLIYWGRLYEYGRVDDPKINAIGVEISRVRKQETKKPNRKP